MYIEISVRISALRVAMNQVVLTPDPATISFEVDFALQGQKYHKVILIQIAANS